MTGYLVRRLSWGVITCVVVLTLVFLLIRVIPGDPAQAILGDQASQVAIDALRNQLGLNKSIPEQYVIFFEGILHGDLGTSMSSGQPVMKEILVVLPWTLELTAVAFVLASLIGIPLGVVCAAHQDGALDQFVGVLALAGISFPPFVSAILLLLLFAVQMTFFPVISDSTGSFGAWFGAICLPALNLGLIKAAYVVRVTRSATIEVLNEDYVRTARAKGISKRAVLWRHAFRNALLPVITIIGVYFGNLIGNSVLTEIVFSRPGLGKLIVSSLVQRDYPMLQGIIVVFTILVIIVNVLTDLTYSVANPTVKLK